MTIKLFSFPYLIKKEIINQLSNKEIILFSFCSLKAQYVAINCLTRKDVKSIRHSYSNRGFVVRIENTDETEESVLAGYSSRQLNRSKLVVIRIGEFQKPIEFDNTDVRNKDSPAALKYQIKHRKRMHEAVAELLSALFRRSSPTISVTFKSVADCERLADMPGIDHTRIQEGKIDAQVLDKHFEKYPNHISVSCIDARITGRFSKDSAFLKVPTIFSKNSPPDSLFKHFKGRELRLCKNEFDTNDAVEFLNKWISGVSYQNLEFLHLYAHVTLNINKRAIIQRFGLTRWPENTPYIFEYESRLDRSNEKEFFDCSGFYQVKRTSDHKLAALEIEANSIKFFVFNDYSQNFFVFSE